MRVVMLFSFVFFLSLFSALSLSSFDVSVKVLETEVSVAEELTFEITVENTGDIDETDVTITYWIDDGKRYSASSLSDVFKGAAIVLGRSFTILSGEASGTHELHVSVESSLTGIPSTAITTFSVAGDTTTSTSAHRETTTTEAELETVSSDEIEFVDYPKEIEIEKGWMKQVNIEIKNNANDALKDIVLEVIGVQSSWIELSPDTIYYLSSGSADTFSVKIAVPSAAETKNYPMSFVVSSGDLKKKVTSILRVFSTKKELVSLNLDAIDEELRELEIWLAKEEGKLNTSAVASVVDEIKDRVRISEKYSNMMEYDVALDMILKAKGLLIEAADVKEEAGPLVIKPVELDYLPIIMIVMIIAVLITAYKLTKRTKLFEKYLKPSLSEIKMLMPKEKNRYELIEEKNRVENVLAILEKEYSRGLISRRSYKEIKDNNVKRLIEIEKKLEGL